MALVYYHVSYIPRPKLDQFNIYEATEIHRYDLEVILKRRIYKLHNLCEYKICSLHRCRITTESVSN